MDANKNTVPHDAISGRAQKIWEAAGRKDGQDLDYWLQAERELSDEAASNEKLESAVKEGDGSDSDHGNSIAYSRAAAMGVVNVQPWPDKTAAEGQKGKKKR
jgi:Protein of unknown function (DUF2934)